jgi:L-alanine-DL-glutamate epimerase-like enolase superfamily enzyme
MKIKRISTAVVESNYDYTYTRIEIENGTYGMGESYFAPGLTAIIREMTPLLLGRDPREIDRLVRHLARKASGAGSTAGIVWNAISGLDVALHDLVGKIYGCPVYQLLGGRVRENVRIYADSHAGECPESWTPMLEERHPKWLKASRKKESYDPTAYAQRAKQVVAKGFDALKFDLDSIVVLTGDELNRPLTNEEVGHMVAVVKATREAVGSKIDLAFDLHWRFRPGDAIRIGRAIEPYSVFWLEDPCPPENWRQIAEVKRSCGVPILTGENLVLTHGFAPLLESQSVDLIAPDIQKCGGLLEAKRIADMADRVGVGLAPHCIASPLGLMASAHVCVTAPNHVALEFHGQDVPFWNDLVKGPPIIQKGRVTPPDKPGIGLELNEKVARQYAKTGELWFGEKP